MLPVMRVVALAASMLCLTPTRGMGTGLSKLDGWSGGSESQPNKDHRHDGQVSLFSSVPAVELLLL